jgi:hypothetical protein
MSDDKIKETSASSTDDTVLTDFKVAAHALLDAVELGLFKRVKVKSDGTIIYSKNTPVTANRIELRRFPNKKDTLDICITLTDKGKYEDTFCLESLYEMRGLFLDENDAKKIVMLKNLERIKERKKAAEKEVRDREQEILELQEKIHGLGVGDDT